jgi:hypothetical protein
MMEIAYETRFCRDAAALCGRYKDEVRMIDREEDEEVKLSNIGVSQLKLLQEEYSAAGAKLLVYADVGPIDVDEVFIEGPMKLHLIENLSTSLKLPWEDTRPWQLHRVQFEDDSWCSFRRSDDEGVDFECHGASIRLSNGCLVVSGRDTSQKFPDGDINPPNTIRLTR